MKKCNYSPVRFVDSTGVSDSIVNQLLSKIDGVDSLNNILIIGMTNRKDMIDEAILRPGRLEVGWYSAPCVFKKFALNLNDSAILRFILADNGAIFIW